MVISTEREREREEDGKRGNTGIAAAYDENGVVAGDVEADEGGEGRVFLVPIEGGGILRVAVVPVPCFTVRLRAGGAAAAARGRRSFACRHFRD